MQTWRKNLIIITIAQLIAMIGMSMVIPFLPLYIKFLGITEQAELERWSGFVVSGVFITAFIATPFWGWLGDKIGRKKMVIRAIFGLAVSQFLIGLAGDVYELFLLRLLQGALSGFIAAALALVSANTPKEHSGKALGLLASSIAAGNVLGPLVGGFLSDSFGYRNVFFITAALCFISGVLIIFFVKEKITVNNKSNNIWDNYKFVFNSKEIGWAMVTLIIASGSISMIQPIFALFIEARIGIVKYIATITGAVFSVMSLFQVISSNWWGKRNDKIGIKFNLTAALIGAGVGYILHVISSGVWELIPIRAFLGFCIGGILPSIYTYIAINTPQDNKGGIMGIASSFTLLGNFIGPFTSGYISSYTSINFVFILSGCFLFVGALLVLKYFGSYKVEPKKT